MTVEKAKGSARVRLGHSELTVRPVGLGCMGMSQFYGAADDSESVDTIRSAIDLGVDFLDTSDVYGAALIATATNVRGFGHNEQLIGAAIHGLRDKGGPGNEVRREGQPSRERDPARWASRVRRRGVRGEPSSTGHRRHRPV